jgi:hypothetical protein
MSDTNKLVAATLAAAKVSADGPDRSFHSYIREYDAFRAFLDNRDKTAADQKTSAHPDAQKAKADRS